MKGNHIPFRTWNSTGVNNAEIPSMSGSPKATALCLSNEWKLPISDPYGISPEILEEHRRSRTYHRGIRIPEREQQNERIVFCLTEEDPMIFDDIEIDVLPKGHLNILICYESKNEHGFRNSLLKIRAGKAAVIKVTIIQLLSGDTDSLQSIYIEAEDSAEVQLTQVEMGGRSVMVNNRCYLNGRESACRMNLLYFGKQEQCLDFNVESILRGKKSQSHLKAVGALKDSARKTFRDTLNFKRGCSGAKGSESEEVIILDDTIRNRSVPILLASEDDVEGDHSASIGRMDDNRLFYVMSRGFNKTEARRLILSSKFSEIIGQIGDEELQNRLFQELEHRIDE